MRPRAGAGPAAPYITMMKHSDQTRANPSFINVTAEAVVEKGPPVPPLPRRGNATRRNTLLHVTLPLHQSCAGRREKAQLIRADKATQTPQLCFSVAEQDFNTAVVRGLCTACVAQRVEHSAGHSESPTGGRLTCSSVRIKPARRCLPTASAAGARKVFLKCFCRMR